MAVLCLALVSLATAVALADSGPTNSASAQTAAQRILGKLQLPPGATRSAGDPSGSKLASPATHPATPNLVDVHSFWRVPGDHFSVFDWIRQHPPAGSTLETQGGGGVNGAISSQWAGFSFLSPTWGGAPSEMLLLTVTAARGGGTAVRADAQVVWQFERPAAERIPAGVQSVSVSERGLNGHRSGRWTVTEPARVKRAASILDALPAGQPGPVACPADWGPYVTLTFASGRGEQVARAVVDGSGCLGVNLWIRGHSQPWLQGNASLVKQLSAALGISL